MCQCQENRLSQSQEREYLRCLRTLQTEGIRVDIPEEWVERSCPLDVIIAPPPTSMVFDWPSGGAGYAVAVRLLSRRACMLEDCAITVSWDEDIVIQTVEQRNSRCVFGPLVFEAKEVLYHRIEKTLRFPRAGCAAEGVILGKGVSRTPKQYTSGARASFALTLYDQYGDEIVEQGHLSVAERARRRTQVVERPKEDLFGNARDGFTEVGSELATRIPLERQPTVVHQAGEREGLAGLHTYANIGS
jgi:hypothetical protein